jgi:hypothetical protein
MPIMIPALTVDASGSRIVASWAAQFQPFNLLFGCYLPDLAGFLTCQP